VISKLKSLHIDGWVGFVLKEKLKLIKLTIKEWHISHSKNVAGKVDSLKARLSILNCKGKDEVLTDDEAAELHGIISCLHLFLVNNCWFKINYLQDQPVNLKDILCFLSCRNS